MMKKLLISVGLIIAAVAGGFFGGILHTAPAPTAGGFNPTGGGTYYLQASISSSQNTITLTSFTEPVSNIPYTMSYLNSDIMYGTIAPQTDNSEFVSFTGISQNSNGTATLTGVVRGLGRSYPYNASTTLANPYPGQTRFILSSPPEFFNEYALKRSDQWITGVWGFGSLPTSSVACTNQNQFCNKAYIDAGLNQGAATSTFSNMGLVQLATNAQVAASTASTTEGRPLVIPSKFSTTTPGTLCTGGVWSCVVVAGTNGKIAQSWLDLTQFFNFTSLFAASASSTNATTTNQWITGIAASSMLKVNSNKQVVAAVGGTDFAKPSYSMASTTGWSTAAVSTSTTVVFIPANTLTGSSSIQFNVQNSCQDTAGGGTQTICTWALRNILGSTIMSATISPADGTTATGWFEGRFVNNGSLVSQKGTFQQFTTTAAGVTNENHGTIGTSLDFSADQTLVIVLSTMSGTGPNVATIPAYAVTVLP